jgi:hypothetical protein
VNAGTDSAVCATSAVHENCNVQHKWSVALVVKELCHLQAPFPNI